MTTPKVRVMKSKYLETIQVTYHGLKKQIKLYYTPSTAQAAYDICDLQGRVLLSGDIAKAETQINITDLTCKQYILLILDGTQAISKKFVVVR